MRSDRSRRRPRRPRSRDQLLAQLSAVFSPTGTTTGQRHAALAGRAEGGAGEVVDHLVEVGVGHDDAVVLGAAERLHALPVRGAAAVDVLRDVGRADEADRLDVGIVEDRVDHLLVAVDDVEDAVGQARFLHQLGEAHRHDGSRSEGLRMKALPQAIATPNIHIGIIAGKLNGVMPATMPSGWRIE
jgi:hypothetical protein